MTTSVPARAQNAQRHSFQALQVSNLKGELIDGSAVVAVVENWIPDIARSCPGRVPPGFWSASSGTSGTSVFGFAAADHQPRPPVLLSRPARFPGTGVDCGR